MSLEGKTPEEISNLAALAEQLGNDPKTRRGFLQLSKIANPDAHIPEVDIPAQVHAVMQKGMERLEAAERKNQEYETERNILARRQSLIDNGKATKADIAAIEKLMIDKKIPDHETAAEFYRMQQEAAAPTPSQTRQTVHESVKTSMNEFNAFKGSLSEKARQVAQLTIEQMRGKGQIKV